MSLLLVQNSKSVVVDKEKNTLTLKGVSPTTLFFSDRPVRMAGHYNKKDYLKLWTDGKDNFDADPPNATPSVFEGDGDDLLDVVVELKNPRYKGDDLIYGINLIEGQLPKLGGPSSLFIDIFGVWRRTARRAVFVGAAACHPSATTCCPGFDKQSVFICCKPQRAKNATETGTDYRGTIPGRIPEVAQLDR